MSRSAKTFGVQVSFVVVSIYCAGLLKYLPGGLKIDYSVCKIEQSGLIMQIHAGDISTNAESFASEKVYTVILLAVCPQVFD